MFGTSIALLNNMTSRTSDYRRYRYIIHHPSTFLGLINLDFRNPHPFLFDVKGDFTLSTLREGSALEAFSTTLHNSLYDSCSYIHVEVKRALKSNNRKKM